ncbi:hypothetical protein M2351_006907 [Azospirillum canadense]|nr:hypothetical protein [Azospirillum canadense]
MLASTEGPIVVNPLGLMGARVFGGPYDGMPYALATALSSGLVAPVELERRGWRYAEGPEIAEFVPSSPPPFPDPLSTTA